MSRRAWPAIHSMAMRGASAVTESASASAAGSRSPWKRALQKPAAIAAGRVARVGWSTDFPDLVRALADRDAFVAVQHAANVFFSAPALLPVIEEHALVAFTRSPLAMGLLTGKYDADSRIADDDVRSNAEGWMSWFEAGRVVPRHLERLGAVRECLQSGGRTPSSVRSRPT